MGFFVDYIIAQMPKKLSPSEEAAWIDNNFDSIISKSNLSVWMPGNCVNVNGKRILLGVAPTWGKYDINLLEAISNNMVACPKSIHIDVFNVDRCDSIENLRHYYTIHSKPTHTPLLGLWINGLQISFAEGYFAREELCSIFCLDKDFFDVN